jgi:hypothetical protein
MAIEDKILKAAGDRTKLIDAIIEEMEKAVSGAQRELLDRVVNEYVDKLEKDANGNIKNSLGNKRKIALLDKVYNSFVEDAGVKLVQKIVKGVTDVMAFNGRYYSAFASKVEMAKIMPETETTINDWLGISGKGKLVENGYLDTLIKDPTIKNQIRNDTFKAIVSQKGYNEVKKGLGDYLMGARQSGTTARDAGAMQKYYRNFVYDSFSIVDRTQAKILGDKLKLKYAIYEGGLIKTSRDFCKKRNGKVFTTEEIAAFDPKEAKPPNYDPFTDLGGYACRHHLNYIPEIVAFTLRPELKKPAAQ